MSQAPPLLNLISPQQVRRLSPQTHFSFSLTKARTWFPPSFPSEFFPEVRGTADPPILSSLSRPENELRSVRLSFLAHPPDDYGEIPAFPLLPLPSQKTENVSFSRSAIPIGKARLKDRLPFPFFPSNSRCFQEACLFPFFPTLWPIDII